jgi:phosphate transport system substrate-binding protein
MKRLLIYALILVTGQFFSCSRSLTPQIAYLRIQGSDTMYLLAMRWAEEYMKENVNVSIYVTGGGTAQGFQALINGQIEICTASRPILPHEVRQLAEQYHRLGIAHLVAKDALSVYLHPANPVNNLTLEQLKKIYTGQITNWQEVGGTDTPIHVLTRSPNSGTYYYFKEHVLNNQEYTNSAMIRFSNQAITEAILNDPAAIGYGGTAFGEKVKHCLINGVAPTIENVISDRYAISRYLYLYTLDTPRGVVNDFITWIMDEPGQVIVAQIGFIPLFGAISPSLPRM